MRIVKAIISPTFAKAFEEGSLGWDKVTNVAEAGLHDVRLTTGAASELEKRQQVAFFCSKRTVVCMTLNYWGIYQCSTRME